MKNIMLWLSSTYFILRTTNHFFFRFWTGPFLRGIEIRKRNPVDIASPSFIVAKITNILILQQQYTADATC